MINSLPGNWRWYGACSGHVKVPKIPHSKKSRTEAAMVRFVGFLKLVRAQHSATNMHWTLFISVAFLVCVFFGWLNFESKFFAPWLVTVTFRVYCSSLLLACVRCLVSVLGMVLNHCMVQGKRQSTKVAKNTEWGSGSIENHRNRTRQRTIRISDGTYSPLGKHSASWLWGAGPDRPIL